MVKSTAAQQRWRGYYTGEIREVRLDPLGSELSEKMKMEAIVWRTSGARKVFHCDHYRWDYTSLNKQGQSSRKSGGKATDDGYTNDNR